MAPEQATGSGTVDHRADLYAFGCLAYAVLTGAPPFSGRSARQIIEAHVSETPRPLSELRPDVPPRIAALVARCLEKDPAKRPQHASEVLDELDAESERTAGRRPASRLVVAGIAAVAILSALGAFVAQRRGGADPSAAALTFAVVPFRNVARDTALDYLADGIGDELLTSMGKVRGLRITARSAAYRYKRRPDANVQAMQRALGARLLVTGTMQQRDGHLIVSAQLNDSMSRGELWSETYVRDAKDVGVVSADIGRAITEELRKHFGAMIGARDSASVGTTNKHALDLYLVGNALVKRRGSGIVQGAAYFERAIAADSNFARAHAALAMALQYNTYFLGTPAEELRERTTSAARRAIALDATLAEPHVALGSMYFQLSDDANAVAEFQRALALDPNDVNAQFTYGRFLMTRVRPAEALVQFRRAQRSERVSPLLSIWAGYAHYLLGHADSAAQESALAVQLDSTLMPVVNLAAMINIGLGRPEVARRIIAVGVPTEAMSILPYVYGRLGDTVAAMRLLREMEAHQPRLWFAGEARASVYLAIGDTARALATYDQAGRVSKSYLTLSDPAYDPIRGSARFTALVRRSGLDPAALAALVGVHGVDAENRRGPALDALAESLIVHEVAHLHATQAGLAFPTRWLEEAFANYVLVAVLGETDPDGLRRVGSLAEAALLVDEDLPTLSTFERDFGEMDIVPSVLAELAITRGVYAAYAREGTSPLARLAEAFRPGVRPRDADYELGRMLATRVHPAIAAIADMFGNRRAELAA
jgi:serine/threonine-protein kinase